jgi:hypothetical protein
MKDIWGMAKSGNWDFKKSDNMAELEKLASLEDENGKTPLHIAAQHGHLGKVPKELLTKARIIKQDKEGKTVLHYSILDIRNGFGNIPKELLSEENMLIEDINNNTLYHMLGYSKDLNRLDKSLIKEEYLMKPNSLGITPIEYVCHGGISGHIIGEESLSFFKKSISKFKEATLSMLKERGSIKGVFRETLEKEIKKRVISNKLSSTQKTIEI